MSWRVGDRLTHPREAGGCHEGAERLASARLCHLSSPVRSSSAWMEGQDKVHKEDVVHTDSKGKEYTVDRQGNRKYLIEQLQYELNDKSKKLQQQKKIK